jgi:hypothetical protein
VHRAARDALWLDERLDTVGAPAAEQAADRRRAGLDSTVAVPISAADPPTSDSRTGYSSLAALPSTD